MGVSWGVLEALGTLLRALGGLLGASWENLGGSWSDLESSWEYLGRLLGVFWVHLGRLLELKNDWGSKNDFKATKATFENYVNFRSEF